MRGVNKVILLGRLGQDPDIRYTGSGSCVAKFSVATSERWKDKNTQEWQEKTEWMRCVAFGRVAEIISEYLHKGSAAYFEGSLQTNKWQDQDGNDRYTTEIKVREMQMLDGKPQGGNQQGGQQQNQRRPANQQQSQNRQQPQQQRGQAGNDNGFTQNQPPQPQNQQPTDFEDDIPF